MPNFRVDYNALTGEDFTLRLSEWQVSRRSRRARYSYLKGGTDSAYFGHEMVIRVAWEYLPPEDAAKIHRMCAAIRSGYEVRVRIFGTDDDAVLGFPFLNSGGGLLPANQQGFPVDLEEEEMEESSGTILDQFPLELTLVTTINTGPGQTHV